MMEKLRLFFQLFRRGSELAEADKWIKHQITANQIATVLLLGAALAKALGYDTHLDNDTALLVAGGVLGLVNWLWSTTTTYTAGLPAKPIQLDPVDMPEPISVRPVPGSTSRIILPPVPPFIKPTQPEDDPYKGGS